MSRVVVVSNTYTYLVRFRFELLSTVESLGHHVTVLCPNDSYAQGTTSLPVERIVLPLAQHGMSPLGELRTLSSLYAQFRRLKPDLVLNFTIKPALYGSIASTAARVPRIVSVFTGLGHWFTTGVSGMTSSLICAGLRLALRGNDLVFFQNGDDRNLFVERGIVARNQTRIVDGSGVDIEAFAPRPSQRGPPTFLLVGRLLREKGIREFVGAARLVRKQYPAARFWLLGPIDANPSAISSAELREWINDGVVEHLGEVTDVRDIVAGATVVVLPSYREGTPRSVLEAMAMGKAIITTDAPGCRETVEDGHNGFLVPVGEVGALADAMMRFIASPDLADKMGAESRHLVVRRYDVRKVNADFLREVGL